MNIIKETLIIATSALSVSACSTATKVPKSEPIIYKVGAGAAKYTSATPRAEPEDGGQVTLTIKGPIHIAAPRAASLVLEQSRVDSDLYKHQRVGKRYTIMGKSYTPKHEPDYDAVGIASWYGDKFQGKPTATGEIYDKNDITAAHKTLPLNSMLYVTNVETGKSIMVRLNDRGPFVGDRIIDLSEEAANELGTKGKGLGKVRVQYAGPADPMAANKSVPAPSAQEYRPFRQQAPNQS